MIKLLAYIFVVIPYIIINLPRMIYYRIRRNNISKIKVYNYAHKFLGNVLWTLGLRVNCEGAENLENFSSYLMVGNHQGMLDPLLLISTVNNGPLYIVAKKELKKMPFVNVFFDMLFGLYMDRGNRRQEVKIMKEIRNRFAHDSCGIVIFPEGTRTKNTNREMNAFLPGTFNVALKEKKPIIPFVLEGTYNGLKLTKRYRNKCYIKYLNPIVYEDYKNLNTIEISSLIEAKIREEQVKLHSLMK